MNRDTQAREWDTLREASEAAREIRPDLGNGDPGRTSNLQPST